MFRMKVFPCFFQNVKLQNEFQTSRRSTNLLAGRFSPDESRRTFWIRLPQSKGLRIPVQSCSKIPTVHGNQKSGEKTHRLDVKKKTVKNGINYQPQLVQDFQPSIMGT